MDLQYRALAIDLALGRITRSDFLSKCGLSPAAISDLVLSFLRDALAAQDREHLEHGLLLGSILDAVQPELTALLAELLVATWHQKHEDLANQLRDLADPRSTDLLARAARMKHEYLAYDNSYALARKCCFALAAIGTPQSKDQLLELARDHDAEIAGYGREGLDNWERSRRSS